jgi:hypothetical protein
MKTAIRISPVPALKPEGELSVPIALFQGNEPFVVLGECRDSLGFPLPIPPSASTLFGPRGACLISQEGPLWVADTGHHRLVGWEHVPNQDNAPADWVIGQPDFKSEGRNAKGPAHSRTFNVPTGITKFRDGLAVADAWNHRVLLWHRIPRDSHTPPDLVLGQEDFHSTSCNHGRSSPAAFTLNWPYGVYSRGDSLYIADTGNRRVLIWHTPPTHNGQAADIVLGQTRFDCRDENAGREPDAMSMRWPHAMTIWNGNLCVTDAGNNRIMVWDGLPSENGEPCRWILGQTAPDLVDHNASLYWPRAETLNMPYGITATGSWLLTADTANSRILGWYESDLHTGAKARALAGQPTFQAKGDNQWSFPVRGSLCWPYQVHACGKWVVVSDSGNNRVQLWALDGALGS